MKKTIIAVTVAIIAVAVHAASFDWYTSSKVYSISADALSTGLAAGTTYGIGSNNASSMYNQISSNGATWSYEMTLTKGGDSQVLTGSLASSDFSARTIAVGGLSSTLFDGATGDSPVTVEYSIILTGALEDGKGASWTITSDAISGSVDYAGVGDLSLSSAGPTKWTTSGSSPVPEPTSGLLMLLGMAGLALKRKRA